MNFIKSCSRRKLIAIIPYSVANLALISYSRVPETLALYVFPTVPKQLSCLRLREEERGKQIAEKQGMSHDNKSKCCENFEPHRLIPIVEIAPL